VAKRTSQASRKPKPKSAAKGKRAAAPKRKTRSPKAPSRANELPRLFGTDGVRAPAGKGPLSPEQLLALGRALGGWLKRQVDGDRRPVVLLGVDPRPSADLIGMTLASGLIAESCDVHWPGMMSTPEVAYLSGNGTFDAGVAVTASHNPAQDNGIKIFGPDGRKLPERVERSLEQAVFSGRTAGDARVRGERFGWLQLGRERHYEDFIVERFRETFQTRRREPLAAVLDVGFGARSMDLQVLSQLAHSLAFGRTVPELRVGSSLQTRGAASGNAVDVYFMNAASPNHPETHHMINNGCGSLHPEGCAEAVRELRADIGICFDGDGDRCVLIDETGEVRDGDFVLALLARDMKARGVLTNDTVVTTTMANLGLERALADAGINLLRTDVGDKHVEAAMQKHGAVLGGEQSGHIIIRDEDGLAGDGLYTALRVVRVMLETGRTLSELCADVRKYPQTIVNIRTNNKPPLGQLTGLRKARTAVTRRLGDGGRINIRYSGTEPLLRIMVEAQDDEALAEAARELERAARADLK
jgi:phosphoglucosamine mutase